MSDASFHTPPQPGGDWSAPDQATLPGDEGAETSAPVAAVRSRPGWKVAAVLVSQLLLLGLVGAAGYLAWSNHDRADRWKARAVTLDRNVAALNDVLVVRSETLNERTRELNAMSAKVRESQGALRRSEADVASLAKRQRELANEKAQVEDERAEVAAQAEAVEGVATAYIDCKNGLVDLLGYVANDDYYSANFYWDSVSADCSYAQQSLSNYLDSYGG